MQRPVRIYKPAKLFVVFGELHLTLYVGVCGYLPYRVVPCRVQILFSMLEIYMEEVRDLLSTKKKRKGGLRIRQHPNKGFYGESASSPASRGSNYT